jgi:hypothetical protein
VDGDPDRDGQPNLAEFFFDTDPMTAGGAPMLLRLDGGDLALLFTRRKDALLQLGSSVQSSEALDATWWSTVDVTEAVLRDDGAIQDVKATLPREDSAARFYRLSIAP